MPSSYQQQQYLARFFIACAPFAASHHFMFFVPYAARLFLAEVVTCVAQQPLVTEPLRVLLTAHAARCYWY